MAFIATTFDCFADLKTMQARKNKGIEGLCYDRINSRLYCVQEKKPISLMSFKLENKTLVSEQKHPVELNSYMDDASSLVWNNEQLWVLSDDSASVNLFSDYKHSGRILLHKGFIIDALLQSPIILIEKNS